MQHINISQILAGLLLLLTTSFLGAQSDGVLNANISPKDALLKVAGEIYDQEAARSVTLSPGAYIVEIWAPRFATFRDTVVVPAGGRVTYNKGLSIFSEDFNVFREDERSVARKKTWRNLSIIGLVGLSVGATFVAFNDNNEQDEFLKRAERANRRIQLSIRPFELAIANEEYDAARAGFDKEGKRARNRALFGSITAVAGWAGSIYGVLKLLKNKSATKPVYQPKDPFTFQSLPKEINNKSQLVPLTAPNSIGFSMQF